MSQDKRAAPGTSVPITPRIWLLMSEKLGDNAQIRTIGDALPWPQEERRIAMRQRYVLGKPAVRASLSHTDPARSDRLEPPWPDLLITSGRRMLNVALWIKERSGGRTKIVLLGRPRRHLEQCDLVVTSSQYRLPQERNILHLAYPLLRLDEPAIAAAAEEWRAEIEAQPRPITALMVGGRIKPVRFDAGVARKLANDVAQLVAASGGTLIVTVSRRTSAEIVDSLAAALPASAILHRWTPGAPRNPYRALLKLADRLVVTGDSVSMLMEIALLGRPLAIYPLPAASWMASQIQKRLGYRLHPAGDEPATGRVLGAIARGLYGLGIGYSRDLASMHRSLVRDGLAVWFGEPFRTGGRRAPDELADVVAHVKALVALPQVKADNDEPGPKD